MYQITVEVSKETFITVNGRSKVISFKSEPINDNDMAWEVFHKAHDITLSLDTVDIYLFKDGVPIGWYRR